MINFMKSNKLVLIYVSLLILSCKERTKQDDKIPDNTYVFQKRYFDNHYSNELVIYDSSRTNRLFDFSNNTSYLIRPHIKNLPNGFCYFLVEGEGIKLKKIDEDLYQLDINKKSNEKVENRFDGCLKAFVTETSNLSFKYTKYREGTKDTLVYQRKITGIISDYCFVLPINSDSIN